MQAKWHQLHRKDIHRIRVRGIMFPAGGWSSADLTTPLFITLRRAPLFWSLGGAFAALYSRGNSIRQGSMHAAATRPARPRSMALPDRRPSSRAVTPREVKTRQASTCTHHKKVSKRLVITQKPRCSSTDNRDGLAERGKDESILESLATQVRLQQQQHMAVLP